MNADFRLDLTFVSENCLHSLLMYRNNKPSKVDEPRRSISRDRGPRDNSRASSRDRSGQSRDRSVSSRDRLERKMERALKKKKRSHSANPENRNQSDSSDSANQGTINRLSSQPRGTVVISRKSREKGKNLKISDDDSAKISDDSALSPDLSRESST